MQQQQRSPVDVLLRVFPGRRRSDVEALLARCRGDVLQAMDLMLCLDQDAVKAEEPKSAFSPLAPPQRYSPRRFLAAPYAGTGYLPTVIRPPLDYALPLLGHPGGPGGLGPNGHHDVFGGSDKNIASSPGSGTGSDKTNYSE